MSTRSFSLLSELGNGTVKASYYGKQLMNNCCNRVNSLKCGSYDGTNHPLTWPFIYLSISQMIKQYRTKLQQVFYKTPNL
uniref:Uncharacterized protein n=1 Tax=Arundo donax TaxID=35708 RepID=A0A0A9GDQ4_ARUDO